MFDFMKALKSRFDATLKLLIAIGTPIAGNTILIGDIQRAEGMFILLLYLALLIGVGYLFDFIRLIDELLQKRFYTKLYAPSVKKVQDALNNIEGKTDAEIKQTLNSVENDLQNTADLFKPFNIPKK